MQFKEILKIYNNSTDKANIRYKLIKNYPKEMELINDKTKWYSKEKLPIKLYILIHNLEDYPTCKCGNTINRFNLKEFKFNEFCTHKKCVYRSKWNSDKKKAYCLEKYGVENQFQRKEIIKANKEKYKSKTAKDKQNIINKRKNTNIKNYGHETPSQNTNIMSKIKATNLRKYGYSTVLMDKKLMDEIKLKKYNVTNVMKVDEIKAKMISTTKNKYGGMGFASSIINAKAKDTLLKNYGVTNPMYSNKIKQKAKDNSIEKWGVEYPMQHPDVLGNQQRNAYRRKEYTWKTGEISILQGYEPIVLKELENKGFLFNEVLTDNKDMPEIWYEFEGKKHRYYPDFFIPSKNLIIEVKSEWTMMKNFQINQIKFLATKKLGFNFKLEVR